MGAALSLTISESVLDENINAIGDEHSKVEDKKKITLPVVTGEGSGKGLTK